MEYWKNINIGGVAKIEKAVAEFDVWDLKNAPYAKYKVKVFESQQGQYIAYTNLQLIDLDGTPYGAVGHGDSVDLALEDAILYFQKMCAERISLTERDFCYVDPTDF